MDKHAIGVPNVSIYSTFDVSEMIARVPEDINLELVEIGHITKAHKLLKKTKGTFEAWCQGGLPYDYVKDVIGDIEETNLIIILRDSDGTMRGIALLNVSESQMELLVLCSAQRPASSDKQDKFYGKGSDLLKLIKFLGRNLKDGIKLYALENVIPLYYKFGWRFIFTCDAKERSYVEDAVKDLATYFEDHRFDLGDKETDELFGILTGFKGRTKGLAEQIREKGIKGKEAFEQVKDNGFEMLLCQENNIYSSLGVEEGKGEGSSKKHHPKRKTKKHRKKKKKKESKKRRKKKKKKKKKKGSKKT